MSRPEPSSKIKDAIRDPKNMGELEDADAVGTVGNSECGEMLRLWVKYKDDDAGRQVIDRATFQSFGCETAIAVASMATEMIRGKTREEALALQGEDLASELGPLPPMKVHCAELVEGALRDALEGKAGETAPTAASSAEGHLMDKMTSAQRAEERVKITFLPE